jgi:hypothetical protein
MGYLSTIYKHPIKIWEAMSTLMDTNLLPGKYVEFKSLIKIIFEYFYLTLHFMTLM